MDRAYPTFDLKTPKDLLQKLKFDEARLKAEPTNSYAAFDFFVTGHALTYWLENAGSRQKVEGKDEYEKQLLKVCSHLGNGAKHFELSYPRHESVRSAEATDGAFGAGVFNASSFQTAQLVIILGEEAARALGGEAVEVCELAEKVVRFWEEKLEQSTLP
jgi:hypothetical protein